MKYTENKIVITSDEHYGHASNHGFGGILKLAKRPFADISHMREFLIARHNEVVPRDRKTLTIHVGDMFWSKMFEQEAIDIMNRLNGRHAFLYGNHDELMEKSEKLRACFDWVRGQNKAGGAELIRWNGHKLTLNHFAQRVWEGSHKGHWHVYGHSHNALPPLGKSFDIGVDGHNFYPWTIEQIERKMETLAQHHTIDNRGSDDVVKESPFDHLPEGSH